MAETFLVHEFHRITSSFESTLCCLDDQVGAADQLRINDAFAERLDLKPLGFGVAEMKRRWRPAFESGVSISQRYKRTSSFISFSLAPWHPSQSSFRRLLISAAVSSRLRPEGVAPV